MDSKAQRECEEDIRRIHELLDSKVFDPENMRHPLHKSAFIELMINLRDLLSKAEKYATRINFTDDIMQNKYVSDITDAVTAVRDACCHIDSFKRRFSGEEGHVSFMVVHGKMGLIRTSTINLRSEYADDIAYIYGENRLYMKRHILRAFLEVCTVLMPLLQNHP